ncbi:MAG: hypothetical protein M1826_005697 [Phylliscum demangeonii]|nr:MAG: hypothetical protein M1826_005697 [Phylliscum demangeonii]
MDRETSSRYNSVDHGTVAFGSAFGSRSLDPPGEATSTLLTGFPTVVSALAEGTGNMETCLRRTVVHVLIRAMELWTHFNQARRELGTIDDDDPHHRLHPHGRALALGVRRVLVEWRRPGLNAAGWVWSNPQQAPPRRAAMPADLELAEEVLQAGRLLRNRRNAEMEAAAPAVVEEPDRRTRTATGWRYRIPLPAAVEVDWDGATPLDAVTAGARLPQILDQVVLGSSCRSETLFFSTETLSHLLVTVMISPFSILQASLIQLCVAANVPHVVWDATHEVAALPLVLVAPPTGLNPSAPLRLRPRRSKKDRSAREEVGMKTGSEKMPTRAADEHPPRRLEKAT